MPSSPLPDLDTVQYPLYNPQVFLSVSNDPPSTVETIKTPLAFYVEKFSLNGNLETENQSGDQLNRFGIFTNELYGPEKTSNGCKLIISGEGGNENHPDAYEGGTLQIFAEHMQGSTAEKLHFEACGGAGANRQPLVGKDTGPDGGNGGNGGNVTIIVDSIFERAAATCLQLMEGLEDAKKKWPSDFEDAIKSVVELITLDDIKTECPVPKRLSTVDDMMKTPKELMKPELLSHFQKLAVLPEKLVATLGQHINVDGGPYGTGAMGDKARGNNGLNGRDGSHSVFLFAKTDNILDSDVCFVHPTQCRMLLDMANLLRYCGSDSEKAHAGNIYSRLARRLAFLGTTADQDKISKTPLATAYRKAEPSLSILSGNPQQEPISFSLLRSVRQEAEGNLLSLLSENTVVDKKTTRDKVPRGSFKFYEDAITPLLENLGRVEKTYRKFLLGQMDVGQKKQAIQDRVAQNKFRKSLVNDQIKQLNNELDENVQRLHISTESIGPAKRALMNAFNLVADKVITHVDVPWEDLISALSQVIFVPESAPSVAAKAPDLIYSAITKLENDSGVKINRSLIIMEVRDMRGSIEGLAEGFRMLKDGGVDFDDPGATKLQVIAQEEVSFWKQFENILGKSVLDNLRRRFDDYIAIVTQRNAAVVGYTTTVLSLIKEQTELDSLAVELADISRDEYNQLGADHPTMTAFMKKMYTDAIHTTQEWLYQAQLSYRFVSLDRENVIGKEMEGFKLSQFDPTTLDSILTTLSTRYKASILKESTDPQKYNGLRYDIDDFYVQQIADSGKDGVLHTIPVPLVPLHGPNPFGSMVNIRLTKVRFYLEGAKTASRFLDVTLKHQGTETILDREHKQFEFEHVPLVFKFRYNMDDPHNMGEGTTDGDIGSIVDEHFAKVGPFAQWTFQITKAHNAGLDLSGVKRAYFMMWFTYYETMDPANRAK